MSEKDDGGPGPQVKFPEVTPVDGWSMRDWFAGQAIACICPKYGDRHGFEDLLAAAQENHRSLQEELAFASYKLADAMISERTKRSGT